MTSFFFKYPTKICRTKINFICRLLNRQVFREVFSNIIYARLYR